MKELIPIIIKRRRSFAMAQDDEGKSKNVVRKYKNDREKYQINEKRGSYVVLSQTKKLQNRSR